ncbi:uncharacterized protein CTHT_0040720 [Thermochaetoides thermophila DSM 1495]|uniref:Uncharacterized protein n=1 Tax=Chaetomium thermophilum (strain DSM 1495 / CBS 144.50 / IMI 039719) TaxID=759272 RepID=G0SA21_CHATD|nr:hypothetical protein CTHT_0040720 [Thermochaetoides thermophila DSM 1495]EGS19593.1 hypothetical protein CTHT_0040720 [Thermochaetoides thermophila DSM 1495]
MPIIVRILRHPPELLDRHTTAAYDTVHLAARVGIKRAILDRVIRAALQGDELPMRAAAAAQQEHEACGCHLVKNLKEWLTIVYDLVADGINMGLNRGVFGNSLRLGKH